MQNIINYDCDNNYGFLEYYADGNENSVKIAFTDYTGNNPKLHIRTSGTFYSLIDCEVAGGVASATIPAEALNGEMLHCRLVTSTNNYAFIHILLNANKPLEFKQINNVVFDNDSINGTNGTFVKLNTYGSLERFLHSELETYTHSQIEGGL